MNNIVIQNIFKLTINLWQNNNFLDKRKNSYGEWYFNVGKRINRYCFFYK
jgi:hypothetical protein